MGVGTTATLSTVPAVSAIWTSSNASIASVHPTTGVVTAHKKGTVTIEAYVFG
ncbi:MAG: Ig-like domain-containing protein [Clostridia bacterium]|nr:Ig-like domain-containing protein [Clostridia bacterium]